MTIKDKYLRKRSQYRRNIRLIFGSPAEMQFIRIMGGIVLTLPFIKYYRTGYPASFVLYRGRTLRKYHIRREVRIGRYWIDFCNQVKGIEIDGRSFHTNKQAETIRTAYVQERGVALLRIEASDIYNKPTQTRVIVNKYLKAR